MGKTSDTFEKQWCKEWEEITTFLNPDRPSIPKDGMITYQKSNGEWGIHGYDLKRIPRELYKAICKLRAYESTGYQPDEIVSVMKNHSSNESEETAAPKSREIQRLLSMKKIYETRQKGFHEAGRLNLADKYTEKIKEINNRISELQGGVKVE